MGRPKNIFKLEERKWNTSKTGTVFIYDFGNSKTRCFGNAISKADYDNNVLWITYNIQMHGIINEGLAQRELYKRLRNAGCPKEMIVIVDSLWSHHGENRYNIQLSIKNKDVPSNEDMIKIEDIIKGMEDYPTE